MSYDFCLPREGAAGSALDLLRAALRAQNGTPVTAMHFDFATTFRDTVQIGALARGLAEQIECCSDGAISFAFHEHNAFGPALRNFDAVSSGNLPFCFSMPGYWEEKDPAFTLFSGAIPFGSGPLEFMGWLYHGGGIEHQQRLFRKFDIVSIPAGLISAECGGWYRREFERAVDFRGARLRFLGLGGELLRSFGAVVHGAGGDFGTILQARAGLLSGALDGLEYLTPAIDAEFALEEVSRFLYMPGWHQMTAAFDLMIHRGAWESLSDSQRAIVETCCKSGVLASLAQGEALQADALRRIANRGTEIRRWSETLLNELKSGWEKLVAEKCSSHPGFAQVWNSYSDFHQSYRDWDRLARLPAE
ncbi:hypothetical protein GC173_14705 [bacterium]|nr:hypothetical protein [bacterium]